jgi:histidinol-phosphate/aromatic aminotransferase/cobyric acid decarboxylase-like protein
MPELKRGCRISQAGNFLHSIGANYFMMEVHRPAEQFVQALVSEKIIAGRILKTRPAQVRITIATQAEMDRFTAA